MTSQIFSLLRTPTRGHPRPILELRCVLDGSFAARRQGFALHALHAGGCPRTGFLPPSPLLLAKLLLCVPSVCGAFREDLNGPFRGFCPKSKFALRLVPQAGRSPRRKLPAARTATGANQPATRLPASNGPKAAPRQCGRPRCPQALPVQRQAGGRVPRPARRRVAGPSHLVRVRVWVRVWVRVRVRVRIRDPTYPWRRD